MQFNFNFIKRHPYGTGAAVLIGGVLLYLLLTRGSTSASASTTSATGGLTEQETLASMGYAAQATTQQNQLAIANLQVGGQQALATIQGTFSLKALDDQLAAQSAQQANNNDSTLKALTIQAATSLAQIQAQSATQQLQISTQAQVSEEQIAAGLQQTQLITAASVVQSQQNAQLQQNLAATSAALQAHLADTNANVAINQSNNYANTQQYIAHQQAKAGEAASNDSMWGGIASIALLALL